MELRKWLIGFLTVAAVAAAAVFALGRLNGERAESGTVKGPAGSPFTIQRPGGWKELSSAEVAALPGSPLAVLRRDDGRGIAIISRQDGRSRDFGRISSDLDKDLPKSIPDFKKVTSHTIAVKAGQAFFYSYTRKKKGTANSIVVVPVDSGRYTINTVVTGGADDVARQVGAMVRSFDA